MKKISVISGGSSGLGLAIAKTLVRQDKNIAIIGRNKEKLLHASHCLLETGNGDVLVFNGNISSQHFIEETYANILKQGYIVDELFNCAGFARFAPPENTTREMIDEVFEASTIGLILMSTYAVKCMRECGGVIVNIMSSAALKGNANESVYCAAKWGARGYTEALKAALKESLINVIGVYPGGMNTSFWKEDSGALPDTSKFMNPNEVAAQIVQATSKRDTMYVSDIIIERN